MRYAVAIFVLILFSISSAFPQEIIENPEKPTNKESGRIIELREVLQIKDDGEEFYFKLPWGIDVANDGSIYVKDGINLYRFSAAGKYEGNILNEGQGPGEIIIELTDIIVRENEVILYCANLVKLIKTDLLGNLLKELILAQKRVTKLIGYYNNKYFLVNNLPADPKMVEGIIDENRNLYIFDEEGNVQKTPFSFQTKILRQIRSIGGRTAATRSNVTRLEISKESNRYIYISHTQEYLIKQFDLNNQTISKCFSRVYPRVKYQVDKRDSRRSLKFYNDVYRLLVYKNQVWALTSTFDEKKGILVDAFNEDGKYIDNFYLPLLNSKTGDEFSQLYFPLVIKDKFLYAIEHDDDWNYHIAKYEIIYK